MRTLSISSSSLLIRSVRISFNGASSEKKEKIGWRSDTTGTTSSACPITHTLLQKVIDNLFALMCGYQALVAQRLQRVLFSSIVERRERTNQRADTGHTKSA
jgi:hypothetical protein